MVHLYVLTGRLEINMHKHNYPFVIAEDKIDEFLQEKADEETINRIYEMAEKFERQLKEKKDE